MRAFLLSGRDLSVDLWGENARDPLETCNPLGVEVYAVDEARLKGWQPPETAQYRGSTDVGLLRLTGSNVSVNVVGSEGLGDSYGASAS